ncbi:hypothetical protein ACA910_015534 [Epithemia clementina (nom. ined.)]
MAAVGVFVRGNVAALAALLDAARKRGNGGMEFANAKERHHPKPRRRGTLAFGLLKSINASAFILMNKRGLSPRTNMATLQTTTIAGKLLRRPQGWRT